jgi:uncharacterized membrane protein YhaH (DUF805 family)
MTRRDFWIIATFVVLVSVGFGLVRSAQGADARTAVLAGVSVIVGTTIGLTVNQVLARRRARRRASQ